MKTKNKKIVLFLFLFIGFFALSKSSFASVNIVQWNFPSDPDDEIADGGTEDNLGKVISVEGVESLSFSYGGKTTNSARATGWDGDDCEKYWQVEFTSVGYENLKISSKQKSSNTGPRDFVLQYRIGADGEWMDVDNGNIKMVNSSTWSALDGLALASDCDNQESVYLRWIKNSNAPVSGSNIESGGASNIDDIFIEGELIGAGEPEDGCVKNSADIKINEVFPGPEKDENEFVELINSGNICVDLLGWKITDETNISNHKYVFLESTIIEPGDLIYIERELFLNNDSDTVFLFDSLMNEDDKENFIDKVEYENVKEGKSYSFTGISWFWCNPTRGDENETCGVDEEEDEYEGGNYVIMLNEIVPNPKGDEEKGEYIEIYNGEDFAISLKDWTLKDSSRKKFVFSEDYKIKPGEYLTVYRDVFGFSLNNSGKESVYLSDPDGNSISAASYDNAKENVSYSFDGSKWNWSKHLTPDKENKFNSAPKVKIKKVESGYVGMPVYFEADVKSKNEDDLRYSWDFDDGGRSYLQNVNHTFKKEGKYKIKLTVDDGATGVEKSFSIKIKKYPKISMEITRLLPNPTGNDTGEEWVEVKNNSSKEINLKGWKIATGLKNLTNHSITDDLKIPSGTTLQITRENSLFFLNNKEANIELRYPNGKTAAKISYKKDKINDDEICVNKGGNCAWLSPKEQEKEDEEIVAEEENQKDDDIFESELSKINFSEEFLRENRGKLSKEENDLLDKIYKIRLIKNGSKNSLAIDLKNGKDFVYELDDSYHFTPSLYQTHWAVDFLEDIKTKVISGLN